MSNVLIDSIAYLKCRLMDIVIGDWDRHPKQYRWYCDTLDARLMFRPIPVDRDQVFFRLQGMIPSLIINFGFMKYMEGFNPTVRNINGFMERGRSLDRKILSKVSKETWRQITGEVQLALTDEVLLKAIERLPAELKGYDEFLYGTMTQRRNSLKKLSLPYYKKIARNKKLPGNT